MRPESAASGRKLSWISIVILALVPILAVGLLLGLARQDAGAPVGAAIVNLDEPVTLGEQYVPMGRQLAAAITEQDDHSVSWMLANEDTAREGLRSGEFAVVVTIPENFSAAATSFSENDAAKATQATIRVDVSENAPITDAQVGEQVARLATQTINATLTETYLDNVYIGLNTVGEQFGTIMEAVTALSDGAGELADGSREAADGGAKLADGLGQLADAAPRLTSGGAQLADGSGQLVTGSAQLATGIGEFAAGVDQLSAGLDQAATGISADGVAEQFVPLGEGAAGLAQGATGVSNGLGAVSTSLAGLSGGNEQAKAAAGQIGAAIADAFQCPVEDPVTCAMLAQAFASGANAAALEGFKAGAGAGLQALNTPNDGVTLLGAAEQVAGGAGQLSDGVDRIMAELPGQFAQLSGALGKLAGGAGQLSDGAGKLTDGASQLATGVAQFDDGVQTYVDGVTQFAGGVTEAADGAPALADGLSQLADGAGQLHEGLDTFAAELESGAQDLPSYTEADRARLAEVVTNPVDAPGGVAGANTTATVSLLLVIGLWLGALLSFVAVRPVPSSVVTSRAPSLALWFRTVALPVVVVGVQGVVLGAIGGAVLGLGASSTALLVVFLAGLAVSFVLANHALTAWLGNVGRGVSVLLAVATVTLAVSSAGGWLGWLDGVSPVQNAFLLIRTHAAGGSGLIGLWATALLLGVIALAASVLAITSRRSLTASQFRRRLAA